MLLLSHSTLPRIRPGENRSESANPCQALDGRMDTLFLATGRVRVVQVHTHHILAHLEYKNVTSSC